MHEQIYVIKIKLNCASLRMWFRGLDMAYRVKGPEFKSRRAHKSVASQIIQTVGAYLVFDIWFMKLLHKFKN